MKLLSNVPPSGDSSELWKHFSDTYFSLRMGLALLAFSLPLVLYFYGRFGHGLLLQPSMSAYFWAATEAQCATFPMRTIFVGYLFAVAVGLYTYKGLTPLENTLLNLASVCAVLVALVPENLKAAETICPAVKAWATGAHTDIHVAAAISLFALLAIISWRCAGKSLEFLPPDQSPARFRRLYQAIALAMILFPLPGLGIAFLFDQASSKVFFIEAAGIWVFGTYWAVKSYELSLSQLEKSPGAALRHAESRRASKQ